MYQNYYCCRWADNRSSHVRNVMWPFKYTAKHSYHSPCTSPANLWWHAWDSSFNPWNRISMAKEIFTSFSNNIRKSGVWSFYMRVNGAYTSVVFRRAFGSNNNDDNNILSKPFITSWANHCSRWAKGRIQSGQVCSLPQSRAEREASIHRPNQVT